MSENMYENPMENQSEQTNLPEDHVSSAEEVPAVNDAPVQSASPEVSVEKNDENHAPHPQPQVQQPVNPQTPPPQPGQMPPPVFGAPMNPPPYGRPMTPPPYGQPVPPPRPTAPPPPVTTYRWTYADQRVHDIQKEKKSRSRGLVLYAVIMTAVFAVSFGLLLGVMFMKGGTVPTIQFDAPVTDENGQIIYSSDHVDAAYIEQAKHSVVLIEAANSGSGTGIILSEDGYIATNHHVIEGATSIRVKFYDGTYVMATVRGSSEIDDLAVLKVDRKGLIPASFAKSSDCFVGQTVYAIGNPSGAEMAWTTTKGSISYVDREVQVTNETTGLLEKKMKMLQTDAMVNPGNSGGPLVNARGQVVGIVSMKLANGYEGIGFAIPSDGAIEIINAIIKDGHAGNVDSNISSKRPIIGINCVYMEGGKYYIFNGNRIAEITEEEAREYPDDVVNPAVSGIYVISVQEGLDAATKLQVGDIITAVNGIPVISQSTLTTEINQLYAGDEIMITFYRNGLYNDVSIVLGAAE